MSARGRERDGRRRSGSIGAERFRLGPWIVDPPSHRLVRFRPRVLEEGGGTSIHIEPRVMELLVALADHVGEVVSRDTLLDTVWHGTVVGDEALTTAIYQLRSALGDDARRARFVETVPKVGYRLVGPVEPAGEGERLHRPPETGTAPPVTVARPPSRRGAAGWRWAVALGACLLVALSLAHLDRWAGHPRGGSPERGEPPPSRPPVRPSLAAEAVDRGWRLLEQTGSRPVTEAVGLFEQATLLAPDDPRAHAGLAEALVRARIHRLPTPPALEPRAAAEAAVAFGPGLAVSHRALAYVRLTLDWDFAGAAAALDRALALDPRDARVHSLRAQLEFVTGRPDAALDSIGRARELAPGSAVIHDLAGTLAGVLGRRDVAERAFLDALVLDPGSEESRHGLAKLRSGPRERSGGGDTDARRGLDRLAAMASHGPVPPSHLAALYAEIGDGGQALVWLDRAWRDRDPGLFFLRYDTRWEAYRDHPRVRELLGHLSASRGASPHVLGS